MSWPDDPEQLRLDDELERLRRYIVKELWARALDQRPWSADITDAVAVEEDDDLERSS
jgi:hypothetical protein